MNLGRESQLLRLKRYERCFYIACRAINDRSRRLTLLKGDNLMSRFNMTILEAEDELSEAEAFLYAVETEYGLMKERNSMEEVHLERMSSHLQSTKTTYNYAFRSARQQMQEFLSKAKRASMVVSTRSMFDNKESHTRMITGSSESLLQHSLEAISDMSDTSEKIEKAREDLREMNIYEHNVLDVRKRRRKRREMFHSLIVLLLIVVESIAIIIIVIYLSQK